MHNCRLPLLTTEQTSLTTTSISFPTFTTVNHGKPHFKLRILHLPPLHKKTTSQHYRNTWDENVQISGNVVPASVMETSKSLHRLGKVGMVKSSLLRRKTPKRFAHSRS